MIPVFTHGELLWLARAVRQVEFLDEPAQLEATTKLETYVACFNRADDGQGQPAARDDAADYERRWLAECRTHGETQRKLQLAHHELGDHSLCSDCDATDEDL